MNCKIEIDNSYCYLSSESIYDFIPIVAEKASFNYTYFQYNRLIRKAERKTRVISFYEIKDKKVIFPRGWFWKVYDSIRNKFNFSPEIVDIREKFTPNKLKLEGIQLFDYQKEAVEKALDYRYGILSHLMGTGKSIIALGIISEVGPPGIIMVPPNRMLMYQFKDLLFQYFPKLKVGLVGDGHLEEGEILIGTSSSFYLKRKKLAKFFEGPLQFLIMDEAHHIREGSFKLKNHYFEVALQINAHLKIALTATPGEKGTLKRSLLEGVTGGVIHSVDYQEGLDHKIIVPMKVFIFDVPLVEYVNYEYNKAYKVNSFDNPFIYNKVFEIVNFLKDKGLNILIICDRISNQLVKLKEILKDAEILYGETPSNERELIKQKFESGEINLLISTIIKEGINIKNIDVIILFSVGKDPEMIKQKFGRGLRSKEGKSYLRLIDFRYDPVGKGSPGILRNHSLQRIRTYKKLGVDIFYNSQLEELV